MKVVVYADVWPESCGAANGNIDVIAAVADKYKGVADRPAVFVLALPPHACLLYD